MEQFKGTDKDRQAMVSKIWENQNKLYAQAQFFLKNGLEKQTIEQKMIESAMWLRLYLEVENIEPNISVAIGTKEKKEPVKQ